MTARLNAIVFRLPIWWSRLYTVGLPRDRSSARRSEIQSDLFEQLSEESAIKPPGALRFEVFWATVRGVPHDLMWRSALLTPGWWIAESLGLISVMTGCSVLASLSTIYIAGFLDSRTAIVFGIVVGMVLGCSMAVALRRHHPFELSVPYEPRFAEPDRKGDPPMTRSFRTWAGLSAIVAALIQFTVVAGYAGGGDINPYSESAELLGKVDDSSLAWSVVTLGSCAIPLFFVPLFVFLATEGGTAARQWGVFAVILVAVHAAINALAYGTAWLFVPLANDYASATVAEQVSLLQQAELVQSTWLMLRVVSGVPFMMAMFVAAVMCFRTRVFPGWMGIVAIILGLQFAPPIAGEFILVPPAVAIWGFGTGFVLLRGNSGSPEAASSPPLSRAAQGI